jgi:glucose/arabinose dehydrogenase
VVFARDVGLARHMAVRPNGDLYVAINNARDGTKGAVLALRDTDGDGRADQRQRFFEDGGNGIAWREGFLYFAPNDRIVRFAIAENALVPSASPAVLVSGLPADGDHVSKTIVLDGPRMFVNFGSASNTCQVQNRVAFSPGKNPCPELPVRAGVWRFSASTLGQTPSSGTHVATGTRNMVALALNPSDGHLYGVQNGRDQLFENWPNLFDARDDALLPAEEYFRIDEGKDYGWPYCYYDPIRKRNVLAPEYGGDGRIIEMCSSKEQPLGTFPAHWAPLGMLFYTGSQFPDKYRHGVFIAFHGSRFDPRFQPAGPGYNVVFQPLNGNRPKGKFQTFADDFAAGNPTPTGAAHRPVALAQGPDGSLYISDDKGGFIYRVFYVGK